jgi:DNA-binding NtrC family response regulator
MADKPTILIVDDEEDFCQTVSDILRHSGYDTIVRQNPVEALELMQVEKVDLVLLDILMPQMDGRQVLTEIVQNHPEVPVIMITGQAYNVPVAIETAKKGSFSFLAKPIDLVQLRESVKQAIDAKRPKVISKSIEEVMKDVGIVSASKAIEQIMGMAEKVAKTTVPVLITGESGVGKEVLARAIHKLSLRCEKPFVSVDCGTLTETLLESELFGHVRGSFTGALTDKKGLFEIADGGSIFLDEIGNTTITFQQKLLNVLNNSKVRRVGDTQEREIDVRVISATNKNLPELIERGEFRDDLYYRLNKYDIHVPPLRNRVEDVPPLVRYLLIKACREHSLQNHYFSPAALDLMAKQEWRGNVRELDSVVTKLAIFAESEEIDVHTVAHALKAEFQPQRGSYQIDRRPLMDQVEEFEKKLITEALKANGGNQTRASEQLGVERTNFVKKMRKHNLNKEDFI